MRDTFLSLENFPSFAEMHLVVVGSRETSYSTYIYCVQAQKEYFGGSTLEREKWMDCLSVKNGPSIKD